MKRILNLFFAKTTSVFLICDKEKIKASKEIQIISLKLLFLTKEKSLINEQKIKSLKITSSIIAEQTKIKKALKNSKRLKEKLPTKT